MIGSYYARFRSFAHDWTSLTAYLKGLFTGQAARYVGHNPAGSYAIFALLVLGFAVTLTGLLVLGGEEGHGPLKAWVGYDTGVMSKTVHEFLASAMLMLVLIHFTGVVFESLYHKENLIWSMITGYKPLEHAKHVNRHGLIAVSMLVALSAFAIQYFHGYFTAPESEPFLAFKNAPLPDNETWRSECGDCHLAYHPVLLPARAWNTIMAQQHDHFEEDLDLDDETIEEITRFLTTYASESGLNEIAHKMTRHIPAHETPIRITETSVWQENHRKIDPIYWKSEQVGSKANCSACHLDAEQGWFDDSNMRLPSLSK